MSLLQKRFATAGMASLLFVATAVSAEVAVIGHQSLPVGVLELQQVRDIWLGKLTRLGDSATVRPVDQGSSSHVRDDFYMKTLDKSPQQVKAYWARITFTGKAEAPLTLGDDAAVKSWIASHPDAIGYIDGASVDGSVKVLLKLK